MAPMAYVSFNDVKLNSRTYVTNVLRKLEFNECRCNAGQTTANAFVSVYTLTLNKNKMTDNYKCVT